MIQHIEELIIYTSDTGTKTVYLRSEKTGFSEVNDQIKWRRWVKWKDILLAAENNQSLENAIQKVEVIYELTR